MQCKEKEPEPKEKEIHYVDYKPDITVTYEDTIADKEGKRLDLYEDGVYDIIAYAYWPSQWFIARNPRIKSVNDSLFIFDGFRYSASQDPILAGTPIGEGEYSRSYIWHYDTYGALALIDFEQNNEIFIALQFHKADGIHYGWLRIRWDTDLKRLYINDYAIQNTPGKEILAGQTGAEK